MRHSTAAAIIIIIIIINMIFRIHRIVTKMRVENMEDAVATEGIRIFDVAAAIIAAAEGNCGNRRTFRKVTVLSIIIRFKDYRVNIMVRS